MTTTTARETTRERETRQRAEDYAAMRAAITDEMRAAAHDYGSVDTEYPAGERVTLRAGKRRTITVDYGELERLALADALTSRGWDIISHRVSFGLYAGRSTVRYGLSARERAI